MPGYSILKPDTNSDSPSVKSKGALLVSAIDDIKNITASGSSGKSNSVDTDWKLINLLKLKEEHNKIIVIIINPKLTS